MRASLVVSLIVLLCPAAALAQTAPATPPSAPPPAAETSHAARNQGRDITRDEYVERAKRAAEKRFDRLDANHDGILTLEERRASRPKRRGPDSQ